MAPALVESCGHLKRVGQEKPVDVLRRIATEPGGSCETTLAPIDMGEAGDLFEVWRAGACGKAAPLDDEWDLSPPNGGHVLRIAIFHPAKADTPVWMHQTNTVDYAVMLEGELTLILEGEERLLRPGDVVVQQGAHHAWVNRGDKPARMAVVLIDAGGIGIPRDQTGLAAG